MMIPRPLAAIVPKVIAWRRFRLERWPETRLLRLAQWIAEPRSLGWFPGWHFGFGDASADPIVQLRKRVWTHFATTQRECSFAMSWYDGLKVWLYLGNDQSWAMFVGGCYEPNEFTFLARVLKPGMTFLDIGANDGLYSLFAAKRVGAQGNVIAVEPSRREFHRLQRNLTLNRLHNVRTLQVAASDRRGEELLRIAGYGHEGHNTLGAFIYDTTLSGIERVRVAPLDDLVEEASLGRADVMKIDVEGAELSVLNGARKVLGRDHPVILLELCEATLRHQGRCSADVLGMLREFGYRTYTFDPASGRPVAGETPSAEDQNIVAIASSESIDIWNRY
jgi:FkbM family methyltransferase